MTRAVDDAVVDEQHPWPGLIAFTERSQHFFHGRTEAETELMRLIRRDSGVMLFGSSGLGKTSLLQAGVFPRLRDEGFFPVLIRLDHQAEAADLAAQTAAHLTWAFDAGHIAYGAIAAEDDDDLWSWLHRKDFEPRDRTGPIVPVLIFDQFEEIFSLGFSSAKRASLCEDFLETLADLIENRTPQWLRDRIEEQPTLLSRYRLGEAGCRVVIALREDYLPYLETLRAKAPSFGRSRLRLVAMTHAEGLAAIVRPGEHVVSGEVALQIVGSLATVGAGRGETAGMIDPAILSLFCRELNERRIARGESLIDSALLSRTRDEILEEFYERSFDGIPQSVRTFVEDELVTDSGVRDERSIERALKAVEPQARAAFEVLVDRRILRREERQSTSRIELVHDVLIEPVRKSRERRANQVELEARLAADRDRRRLYWQRRGRIAIGVAAIGIVAAIAIFSARLGRYDERGRAEAERRAYGCAITLLAPPSQGTGSLDYLPDANVGAVASLVGQQDAHADCGDRLADLLQRARKSPGEAISWAATLSALPSSEDWRTKVRRIDLTIRANAQSGETSRLAGDIAAARLIEAQVLLSAGQLMRAATATRAAISWTDQMPTAPAKTARLVDLYSRLGEIYLRAGDAVNAEPSLRRALEMRRALVTTDALRAGRAVGDERRALAQSYADMGRVSLMLIAARPTQRDMLMERSDRFYDSCLSRTDGAGVGLSRKATEWQWIARRCWAHQAKSLGPIDQAKSNSAFHRILGITSLDLNTVPEAEKRDFYDVLEAVADYHQQAFLRNPADTGSRHLAIVYRRWLMVAQRDVLSRSFSLTHRDDLVTALLNLGELYLLIDRGKDALQLGEGAHLLDSNNGRVKRIWGTAVLMDGNRCKAENLYREAAGIDGVEANLKALQSLFDQIARIGRSPAQVDRMLAILRQPDPGPGKRQSCVGGANSVAGIESDANVLRLIADHALSIAGRDRTSLRPGHRWAFG